jgi:hypothetical protein
MDIMSKEGRTVVHSSSLFKKGIMSLICSKKASGRWEETLICVSGSLSHRSPEKMWDIHNRPPLVYCSESLWDRASGWLVWSLVRCWAATPLGLLEKHAARRTAPVDSSALGSWQIHVFLGAPVLCLNDFWHLSTPLFPVPADMRAE